MDKLATDTPRYKCAPGFLFYGDLFLIYYNR